MVGIVIEHNRHQNSTEYILENSTSDDLLLNNWTVQSENILTRNGPR